MDEEGEKAGLTGVGVAAAPAASSGRFLGMASKKAPPPPVPRSRRSTVSNREEAVNGKRGGGQVELDEGENPFH